MEEDVQDEPDDGQGKDEDDELRFGTITGDLLKYEEEKKKKGRKGKRDKKKKVVHSLLDIPVIKKEKPTEHEPNIKMEGLKNVKLTFLTQKILGCIVGEHVTAEAPWVAVDKELVDENLYLHHESSDFLPLKDDLANYNDSTLLLGYDPDFIPYEGEEVHRFYIAVTEKAREDLLQKLDEDRRIAEEKLKNSVNKKILPWTSLGSELEVDFSTARNTRPLIELELETDIDELLRPVQFQDRNVEDAKDGYVRIGPGRHEFSGIRKRRVDTSVQAVPMVTPHFAQTDPGIPSNAWTQYVYDMDTAREAIERGSVAELQPDYQFDEQNYITKSLEYNESFDLYTNDYPLLVKHEEDDEIPCKALFEEYQAFKDVAHCKKMLISSIAWHPMWTGVVALSYSVAVRCLPASEGDASLDKVMRDIYAKNPVLIWSFKDSLQPRLVLESPREVYTISWCPTEPNVLVGGCASGQIIIWDLKGKLEAVEGHECLTPDQKKYRLALETLVGWVKPQAAAKYVRPAALSNIQYSHAGRVTQVQWIPPYYEWSEDGHLMQIPAAESRTSMQVISSGEDGVVLVWDLYKLSPETGPAKAKKRKARKRPSALTSQISPFKAGDRKFKPIYMLYPDIPDVRTHHKLTALSMKFVPLSYELDISPESVPNESQVGHHDTKTEVQRGETLEEKTSTIKDAETQEREVTEITTSEQSRTGGREGMIDEKKLEDESEERTECIETVDRNTMTYREIYRPVVVPPEVEPQQQLNLATDEGETMIICWEGFDFQKGEEITTEAGKIINSGCAIHDGPIVTCARSPFLDNLILTVGGKVFALWTEELNNMALFWKTSDGRLTCGSWSPYRPCTFHIGRADGSLEVWDFLTRSDAPILVQSLSGQVLTSMHEHTLPLFGGHNILGVADYNNSFRLLYFPEEYKKPRPKELEALKNFVSGEINLKLTYHSWNEAFLKCNAEELSKLRAQEEEEEKAKREAEQIAEQEAQLRAKLEEEETKRLSKARNTMASISNKYFEKLRDEREKQMQRVLMEKKRLDKSELVAKQQPILMMRQMEKEKRKKQREKVRQQQKIFDKTVAMLFPEVVEKPKEGPGKMDNFETELLSRHANLMEEYEEMVGSQLKYIAENPFNKRLKWDKLFAEGRERRNILDFPLYLRRKRVERYVAGNESRYKYTLGHPPSHSNRPTEYDRRMTVGFKNELFQPSSELDVEYEGESGEEDELFAEGDEEGASDVEL